MGPKGRGFMTPKKDIKRPYFCDNPVCGAQIGDPNKVGCKCPACGKLCTTNNPGDYKNAPDQPGEKVTPLTPIEMQPGSRIGSDLLYDAKNKKFIMSGEGILEKDIFRHHRFKEDKDDKKTEDGKPRLRDDHISEEDFKQIPKVPFHSRKNKRLVDDSDATCTLDRDEAKSMCDNLCIDG